MWRRTRRRTRLFELQKTTGEAMRCIRQGDAWDAWDSESSVFQSDSKLFHVPRRSLKSFYRDCVCPLVTTLLLTGFQCHCILCVFYLCQNICFRLVLVWNPSFCGQWHFNPRLLRAKTLERGVQMSTALRAECPIKNRQRTSITTQNLCTRQEKEDTLCYLCHLI